MIALNQTKKPAKWCPGLTPDMSLTRGIVGYYPLWEGDGSVLGGVRGAAGSRNNAVWGTGAAGHCLTFDGNDQYATLPSSVGGVVSGSAWTWSCWCYMTSYWERLICNELWGASLFGWKLEWKREDSSMVIWNFPIRVPQDRWVHVAWVQDMRAGIGAKLYLDGKLAGQDATMTDPVNDLVNTINIGGQKNLPYGNPQWMDGSVADVAVYDRALSAGEVARLVRRPFGLCRPPRGAWPIRLAGPIEGPYRVAAGNVWYGGAEAGGQHLTGTGAGIALVDGQQAGRTHG